MNTKKVLTAFMVAALAVIVFAQSAGAWTLTAAHASDQGGEKIFTNDDQASRELAQTLGFLA